MKLKNFLTAVATLFVIAAIAAGVAAAVYKVLNRKKGEQKYIECECDPDSVY
ncbi:MAG TPA: hypothetical protein GXX17_01415 [Clostridiales bacterium]|nr:hypothetical protein [Clostridiales bacterium]